MTPMTANQLFEEFTRFMAARGGSTYQAMPNFVPDQATLARKLAFDKWQDLQHATAHAALLAGQSQADALEAWHRLMIQFSDLFDKCKAFNPFKVEQAALPGTTDQK